jgi:hypothetical protein
MSQLTRASRIQPAPAPPDLAARMRHYVILIVGGTLVLALGFIGVQIYLLKAMGKPHDEDHPQRPAWISSTSPVADARPLVLPELKSKDGTPKADSQEVVLAAVGGLMSAHLYQTYVSVGLLADSVEEGVYPLPKAKGLLETINSFIDHAERQLIQLPPSAFPTEEDRKAMETARGVLTLLRVQTKELRGYWDVEDGAAGAQEERALHIKRFREARAEAGVMIQKLVDVQE